MVESDAVSSALALEHVTKRYGGFAAVDDLNLEVPTGRITGFLGPNGAGKTTTIRMIMSIIYPDSGAIRVLGHDSALSVKDRIGYLPEERGLYRKMTVEHTLRYFGRLKGMRGDALQRRIEQQLERVGLRDWLRKPVESLSKGMQQKLQFISTILHDPDLVILDEPFSGLDPLNMELLKDLLLELRDAGKTVIFSTHQMDQAQRLCDRLVLINRGRKLVSGTLEEIRSGFSARIVTLEGDGDFAPLAAHSGVVEAQILEDRARFELDDEADANELLRRATELGRITKFEIQRPDLHEIFVKLVEQDAVGRTPAEPVAQEAAV
ncbi:MAG: ATP-binding cassette domain-containing protein [Planctomycetota bacterium]|nr:MAG: ATP-binding cassette domain-containing protein [Planctomycetota bacterium]